MSMQITDSYGNNKLYSNQTTKGKAIDKTKSNIPAVDKKMGTDEYLKELQEKNPKISIMEGNSDRSIRGAMDTNKTDVRIAPNILSQMVSDPAAQKYEKMLSQIPALDKWADSMINAMTGSKVQADVD